MSRPVTFRIVQALAAQAGLVMSREPGTWRIRLRDRDRPSGPVWTVATLAEALDVIDQRVGQDQSKAA